MAADKLIIRSYPKVIFFYPTFLVSVVIMLFAVILPGTFVSPESQKICGAIFALTFAFNLIVFAINFTRHIFLNIMIGVFMLVFLLLWLNTMYPGLFGSIGHMIRSIEIIMNAGFYSFMSFVFGVIFIIVYTDTRFEYWEVTSNEIISHTGFFSDVKRYPAPSLKYDQVISDVFEYMLARAGNIRMTPAGERETIVLENIINVKKVFARLDEILSKTEVEVVQNKPQPNPPNQAV